MNSEDALTLVRGMTADEAHQFLQGQEMVFNGRPAEIRCVRQDGRDIAVPVDEKNPGRFNVAVDAEGKIVEVVGLY